MNRIELLLNCTDRHGFDGAEMYTPHGWHFLWRQLEEDGYVVLQKPTGTSKDLHLRYDLTLAGKLLVMAFVQADRGLTIPERRYMLDMKYFVLKPGGNSRHHKASRMAMRAYARYIKQFDEKFAEELCAWANKEAEKYSNLPEEDF